MKSGDPICSLAWNSDEAAVLVLQPVPRVRTKVRSGQMVLQLFPTRRCAARVGRGWRICCLCGSKAGLV